MDTLASATANKPFALLSTIVVLSVLYFVGSIVHRLYFHPLRHIPGPWINAVSRVPYARHLLAGTTVNNAKQLHDKYGEVVRLSPNELSFISGETAWQDIYGFRTGKLKGHVNMQKDPQWYPPPPGGKHIIFSNDEDHSRYRKVLSHAFSEKALAQQEVLLQQYVDQLIDSMKDVTSTEDGTQDMCAWYNWTTFDIIADLIFGEPFGGLRDRATHKYIKLLFSSLKAFPLRYVMNYWPITKHLRSLVIDQAVVQSRADFYAWVSGQTEKRVERETQRPDFMTEILKHNGDKGVELTPRELYDNAGVFLIAGSETTATLLSGATYCLLQNPDVMQKLQDEVRGTWKKYDDITLDEVNKAPYLIAVLQESLRYFPPVPTGFQRKVGKGGEIISGHFIPEDTAVCVSSYPGAHSERNFKDPESFVPERWMGDPRFADDNRISLQPFSFGPRNCLGKNLAYAEMRLILAKMIWSFDLELDPKSENWFKECKVLTLWEKPELAVHVKEVVRLE